MEKDRRIMRNREQRGMAFWFPLFFYDTLVAPDNDTIDWMTFRWMSDNFFRAAPFYLR